MDKETLGLKLKTKGLSIDASMRVCANCKWYEQYYRENRGNVRCYIPVPYGYCLQQPCPKSPLATPCKHFGSE